MTDTTKPRRTSSLKFTILGSIFLLMVGVVVFVLVIAPALETNILTTWRCDVTSAEPRQSSGTYKGTTTLPSVLLHTTDCGQIVLQKGITFENSAARAADLAPGVYDFQIGWVSAHLITLLPHGLPEAQSYRAVP